MDVITVAKLKIKGQFVDLRQFTDKKLGKVYYIARVYHFKETKIQLSRATYEIFDEEMAYCAFRSFSRKVLEEA